MTSPAAIVRDPLWFAHRYDPGHDAFQFRRLSRDDHRAATFLTDDYLGVAVPTAVRRSDALAAAPATGPLHFIFHSAFCCSTVLARAFDVPGAAMGIKEPVLLNDLVGWQHRGGSAAQIAPVLDAGLTLLARPLGAGEAVIVKPSNVTNGLAPGMMTMRPAARALLLYAPLRVYLASIARKGMTGRLWVRDLLVKQLREGLHPFGFTGEDYLGQTDLQAAAIGWLAQHALFARMAETFGDRVRTADSERLMTDPVATLAALATLFGVTLDAAEIAQGPAFTRHSKFGGAFGAAQRVDEQVQGTSGHADEIDKVVVWTEAVAASAGVPMELPQPLLR
ncbi:hypothetical protein [Polymorphobacter fuscus]|uniref:Sulfotransferase family protein n=1 Tax=Sandarakinorhabdus fusca TaxID=1439888 RepID=A0A7C9LHX6_9SPHN|nr:hypothetical protein [Polymorphobacter fuscus]KAB7644158.1 hypothetical protein F9290_14930 [Polymorphobacter fuscus]MQT18547.1 hypothetical protein [Polymorphobacter fuscus]NJC08330.1 hypothetical protein [Polymorphobacter fuscus]